MRILTFAIAAGLCLAASSVAAATFTPPQVSIVDNSPKPRDFHEAQKLYGAAQATCLAKPTTVDKDSFIACMNKELAPKNLAVQAS